MSGLPERLSLGGPTGTYAFPSLLWADMLINKGN